MRGDRTYVVYILASGHYGTLNLTRLVYMEAFGFITDAIRREKQLKHWPREWKTNLIERENPH